MYCNILIDADGNYYCQNCKVPFTGPFEITERNLKAIGGNLKKFLRPCNLHVSNTGWLPAPMPTPRTLLPIVEVSRCIHRSEQHTRLVLCPSCGGTKTKIKVFGCSQYGECALTDRVPNVAVCSPTCPKLELPVEPST